MTWECWRDPAHPVAPHPVFGWPQCRVCGAAPPYHERPGYLPDDFTVTVYVPLMDLCAPGSAVVGANLNSLTPDLVTVYYEGWVHGARQYADRNAHGKWEAGVLHATGRMVTAYPTIATAHVRDENLHEIGTYNPRTRDIVVTDETALADWLSEERDHG